MSQSVVNSENNLDEKKEPIRYYWFDSYLEYNMYNTIPSKLMDLSKRYGVSLNHTKNKDDFMDQVQKKKNEEIEQRKKQISVPKKCFECEKRNKSQHVINSHYQTECKFIRGNLKYKNYPDWIKEIINTKHNLYQDLKVKSKMSKIRFDECFSYEEFNDKFCDNEEMMDLFYGF